MSWTWQDVVAISVVLAAVVYLLRHFSQCMLTPTGEGCTHCGLKKACPSQPKSGKPVLVLQPIRVNPR